MFLLQETSFILADNKVNFEITSHKLSGFDSQKEIEAIVANYKEKKDNKWFIIEDHCYLIDGSTDNPTLKYRYIANNDQEKIFLSWDQLDVNRTELNDYIDMLNNHNAIIKKHRSWVENNLPNKIADNDLSAINPDIINIINNYGYIDKCSKFSGLPRYILYLLELDPDRTDCSVHDSYCDCEDIFSDCLDCCKVCKDNLDNCDCLCHDFRNYGCTNNDHCGDNCDYSSSLAIYNISENDFNNIERQYLELDPNIKIVTIHTREDGLLEYWSD